MKIMRLLYLIALLALAACAPRQQTYPPPVPEQPAPEPEQPAQDEPGAPSADGPAPSTAPQSAEEASGAAVVALLGQGDQHANAGEYERAAAAVERALDVEPRNPFIYQRLAALRLKQERPEQAETLARKSNSLGGDNPYLQARNWLLIEQALRAQGDPVGADSAASRAGYYRDRSQQ